MAFSISDIFKSDIDSCPERVKSFLIRDILSMPTVAKMTSAVQRCAATETGNATSSSTLLKADCLDRHQFNAVSLYLPSSIHRHHHQQQQLTAALQQPQTTFIMPTDNGNNCYFSLCRLAL